MRRRDVATLYPEQDIDGTFGLTIGELEIRADSNRSLFQHILNEGQCLVDCCAGPEVKGCGPALKNRGDPIES